MKKATALLHPSVALTPTPDGGFEIHDRRTDLRLAFEEGPVPSRTALEGELLSLCDELGLLDDGSNELEVRRRQRRFGETQAWEERLERLRTLLRFAIDKVPHYRERRSEYEPDRVTNREALEKLPLLRKADVRTAFMRLVPDNLDVKAETERGRLELVSTSGTTDERLQTFSDATLVRVPSNYDAVFGIARLPGVPRTAVFTSVTCLAQGCTLSSDAPSARLVHGYTLYLPAVRDPFALDGDAVRVIADEMARFEPAFLFVNPVYAHLLGRRAAELGVALPPVHLLISCYQYATEIQRRALERYFAAPVRNLYAATELGGCQIGLECHRGHLHLREDHCLVECLTPSGPAAAGEVGALVVTTLASTTMPLVRYLVGDLAEPEEETCDCPLSDWPSIRFHGRERDALYLGSRFVTTRQLDSIVGLEPGVDFYCCRQTGESSLVLEIVPSLDATFSPVSLAERLESTLGGAAVQVRVQRRLEPAPSLKYSPTAREIPAPAWLA
jgi:phenylacetate-CoA ligase